MTFNNSSTVAGVFSDRQHADQAIDELSRAGFSRADIGVVARDLPMHRSDSTHREKVEGEETYAEEGAAAGALAGAGIGGLIGLGVLSGVVPVIGPAIAAGTLATILTNAAVGAAVVGLTGALVGSGVPEEQAQFYVGEVQAGRIVVTVNAGDRIDEARRIMQQFGAQTEQPTVTATPY